MTINIRYYRCGTICYHRAAIAFDLRELYLKAEEVFARGSKDPGPGLF